MIDPRIASVSQALEAALRLQSLRPEDLEATASFFSPFEREMSALPSPPVVPDNAAGTILRLLWCKTHPENADLPFLLNVLSDSSPMVRLHAVDALSAAVDTKTNWTDSVFLNMAREAVQSVAHNETSPLLAGQLAGVSERLNRWARPRRQTHARVVANPYTAGPPVRSPKNFFGRSDVLAQIGTLVSSGGTTRAVVLHGARRTGKSSLLYRIVDGALGQEVVPVYLDMQGLAGSPLKSLLRVLLRLTWQALGSEPDYVPSSEPDFSELREYFDAALSRLGNRSIVLMFDEYEVLETFLASGLGGQLQSLLESAPNLFIIFAGSRKLEAISDEAFSSLVDLARYIKMTFLSRAEATRLITDPSHGMLDFASGVPERIFDLTNGHPFYTQLLCQSLFEIASSTSRVATLVDVNEVVKRFLQNPAPHLVLSWNTLRAGEAAVGSMLALLQGDMGDAVEPAAIAARLKAERFPLPLKVPAVQRILNTLSHSDWVAKQKERNAYRFTMELVRRWVAEERPIASLTARQELELASRTASYMRQRAAWALDVAVCAVLAVVGATIAGAVVGAAAIAAMTDQAVWLIWLIWLSAVLPVFAYLSSALWFGEATVGMKAFRIQATPAPGHSLMSIRRCAWIAVLYALRLVTAVFVVLLPFALVLEAERGVLVFGLVALVLEALDNVMIWNGERRQGLWEKLGGILIVPTEALRL